MDEITCRSISDIQGALRRARSEGSRVYVASATSMSDVANARMKGIRLVNASNRILNYDVRAGTITVEAGCTWSDIVRHVSPRYTVKSCQSGLLFTVGGSICGNAHGRKLASPMVMDSVVWFDYVAADGGVHRCHNHSDVFQAFFGSLGLIGIIANVHLDLMPNYTVRVSTYITSKPIPELIDSVCRDPKNIMFNAQVGRNDAIVQVHSITWDPAPQDCSASKSNRKYIVIKLSVIIALFWIMQRIGFDTFKIEKRLASSTPDLVACMNDAYDRWERPMFPNFRIIEFFFPLREYNCTYRTLLDIFEGHCTVVSFGSRIIWQSYRRSCSYMSFSSEASRADPWLSVVIDCVASGRNRLKITNAIRDRILRQGLRLTYHTTYDWPFSRQDISHMFPGLECFEALKRRMDPTGLLQNVFSWKYLN